jgi:hypothetical protein
VPLTCSTRSNISIYKHQVISIMQRNIKGHKNRNDLFHKLRGENLGGKKFANVLFSGGFIWHCQLLDHTALNDG